MGYEKIHNLYREKAILEFKHVYAMEKIHGTSAHLFWKDNKLSFFSGGATHSNFVALFDKETLEQKFREFGREKVCIYGEAYGGKLQGMSDTYGKKLKFVAFEVKIDGCWLAVPDAEEVSRIFDLEFVSYRLISTDIESLNQERARPSVQASRNGCGDNKKSEGIVLRPIIELTKSNGERLMAKYKNEEFRETKTPRPITEDKQKTLTEAKEVADEWVTEMRLTHVLDKLPASTSIENIPTVLAAMIEDIRAESSGEIVFSREVFSAINRKTAVMFKQKLQNNLQNNS